jgi:H+/Cl- antiporter ClcA
MIACGAGAGLAAVYNIPLAGTVFVLEVLLRSIQPTVVIPAIVTSWIATVVARTGLGDAKPRLPNVDFGTFSSRERRPLASTLNGTLSATT